MEGACGTCVRAQWIRISVVVGNWRACTGIGAESHESKLQAVSSRDVQPRLQPRGSDNRPCPGVKQEPTEFAKSRSLQRQPRQRTRYMSLHFSHGPGTSASLSVFWPSMSGDSYGL
jgi:hypothetical protein